MRGSSRPRSLAPSARMMTDALGRLDRRFQYRRRLLLAPLPLAEQEVYSPLATGKLSPGGHGITAAGLRSKTAEAKDGQER